MTRVLGIDPGTHRIGWGIVEGVSNHPVLVEADCLEFPKGTNVREYLTKIQLFIEQLVTTYRPDRVGIEALFLQKNVSTVMSVAEARGVILYTLAKRHIPWTELSPNTIKSAVAGSGSAGKIEVSRMVGLLLKTETKKLLDDTTDALAIALAVQSMKL